MKSFLILSVLLLFVTQIYAGCFQGSVPAGYPSGVFYATPQNITIDACDISNENACCTQDLSHSIQAYSDVWSAGFLTQFQYTSTTCKGAIQGLSCLLCSSNQNSLVSFHGANMQYFLCTSYCSQLLTACGTSRVTNGTYVNNLFNSNSVDFCYYVFEGITNYGVSLVLVSGDNCWNDEAACEESSYYSEYTQCIDGTRSKIYQKKPEVVCSGGVPLPPTEVGLPCQLSCPMGQFSSPAGCANCPLGTYSLGSAVREDAWSSWDTLNIPFQTYCKDYNGNQVNDASCGWKLTGGFEINSGSLNNSLSAYLETSVVLLSDGTMAFDYKVDAEPRYDGLTVYVDRAIVLPKVSTQLEFKLQTINLTAGYHFIQFVYSKDLSVSVGLDQAALNLVQFTPVSYAADECTPCRAGRYQNATGKSYCYDCAANTFSNLGSSRCTKCPPNYYSFSGSSTCTPQADCTIDDVYYMYGACYFDGQHNLVQDQYPLWNSPHICNDHGNPTPNYPNITAPCVPCNPGERRVGTECELCPDGYYSTSGESCEICSEGSSAVKILYLDHFDSFNSEFSTDCSYFCGSPGWELHNDYIDSGSGHGRYVNSNLRLNTTLTNPGALLFVFTLSCRSACSLTFTLSNTTGGTYTGGPSVLFPPTNATVTRQLPAGPVVVQWTFTKNDPTDTNGRNDNARIDFIGISNVEVGGAANCTGCKAGTYSPSAGAASCLPCEAGTFSGNSSVSCTPCPDGTFNTLPGQATCSPCGENTPSNANHTSCIISCTFLDVQIPDDESDSGTDNDGSVNADDYDDYGVDDVDVVVSYDLTPLIRGDDEMYGPIYDIHNNAYFVNLCIKEHNNNTCVSLDGTPLYTYACQVTPIGVGEDLGSIFGIIPLRERNTNDQYWEDMEGVTVHLTNGQTCINTTSGQRFPRQAFIDVICDPLAGVGYPTPLYENNTIESSKCVYEFLWYSLYGCHVCTPDDYSYVITACDNNNKRQIQYYWIDNPKSCHSGVDLPEDQELSCTNEDETYCPPGQFLDLSVPNPVCTDADPGFYSIGGGELFDDWSSLPNGFSSITWTATDDGSGIRSGFGDSSLFYLHEFVEVGQVSVIFKVFGYGNSNGGLLISLDNSPINDTISTTDGVWAIANFYNIAKGHRFLTFQFKGGVVSSNEDEDVGAIISSILVMGISHAAEQQLECPEGTFSTGGASSCTPCPANTYSYGSAATSCDTCLSGSFSFEGSIGCILRLPCTLDDYQAVYEICDPDTSTRTVSYRPLLPFYCDDSNMEFPVTTVPCDSFDCEPGEYRSNASPFCLSCASGLYWDSAKQQCSQSSPGYAGTLQKGYYNQPTVELPPEFSTGCSGDYCSSTSNGWRSRSTFIDSGENFYNPVDSYLNLHVDLTFDGSVSFTYSLVGNAISSGTGLFLFIDSKQQNLPYHPSSHRSSSVSFSLPAGTHTIRWVYHQQRGDTATAQVSNILLTGTGSSTSQVACPVGTYSNSVGSSGCTPCSPGTFSSAPAATSCSSCSADFFASSSGSSSCSPCGALTYSNSDHTDCHTTCSFQVSNGTVDLSPLSDVLNLIDYGDYDNLLWINVCQKKSSSVYCLDPITGDSISTYSCQVDSNGNGIDSGSLLSVSVNSQDQILMTYSNGQITEDCPSPIVTEILFNCDPNDDQSTPYPLKGSTTCHIKLQWDIAFACPVCTDDDYDKKSTDCNDGKLTSAQIRQNPCYGPLVKNSQTEDCKVPIHVPWYLLIIVGVVVVLLVIVIVIIVIWNRRLHSQYSALIQKEGGNYEMSEKSAPNSAVEPKSEA